MTSRLNWQATKKHRDLIDQSGQWPEFNTMNWRDTTHFDSEDDYRTGRGNVSHYQQQESYSGLRSPGRSYSTYLRNDSWVQTFHNMGMFVSNSISILKMLYVLSLDQEISGCALFQ